MGVHGLDGGVKVLPSSDFVAEWPRRLTMVVVDRLDWRAVRVVGVRRSGTVPVLRLEGVDTRTAAEGLVGARLFVPVAALPPLPPGSYYWHDLLDRVVRAPDGGVLGTVRHVTRAGPHDVLEVAGPEGSWLVPFVRAWVAEAADGALALLQDPRHAD